MYVAMRAINLLPSLLNPITSSAMNKIPPTTLTSTRLYSPKGNVKASNSSVSISRPIILNNLTCFNFFFFIYLDNYPTDNKWLLPADLPALAKTRHTLHKPKNIPLPAQSIGQLYWQIKMTKSVDNLLEVFLVSGHQLTQTHQPSALLIHCLD